MDQITVKGKIRRPERLGADKGYDDDKFRKELRKRRIIPCLVRRKNNQKNIARSELREKNTVSRGGKLRGALIGLTIIVGLTGLWKRKPLIIKDSVI